MKPKPLEKGMALAILAPLVIVSIGLLLNPQSSKEKPIEAPEGWTPPPAPNGPPLTTSTPPSEVPSETPTTQTSSSDAPTALPNPDGGMAPSEARSNRKISLPKIVAKVNGNPIKGETLENALTEALQGEAILEENLSDEQKLLGASALLNELVLDEILTQHLGNQTISEEAIEAEVQKTRSNFANETEFKAFLKASGLTPTKLKKEIRETLAKRQWLEAQAKPIEISTETAKAFYEKNLKDFQKPETLRAQHILFLLNDGDSPEVVETKKAAAQKAYERASQGEDFGSLAKEISEEPGAQESAGEIGFFSRELVVPEFADAAFSLEAGQVGPPVLTPFGWHVIKVLEKVPAETPPFEKIQQNIVEFLQATSKFESQTAALKNLESTAKVEVFLTKETLYTPKPAKKKAALKKDNSSTEAPPVPAAEAAPSAENAQPDSGSKAEPTGSPTESQEESEARLDRAELQD